MALSRMSGKMLIVSFLLSVSLIEGVQGHSKPGCEDMVWPGGQKPCPSLIELYNSKAEFCAAEYYAEHCCKTCALRAQMIRPEKRGQGLDSLLSMLLKRKT